MKQYLHLSPHSRTRAAFTIVELLVVIVVIAILVTITTVGFSQWRSRAATTEVKADSSGVQSGMEDARNRSNGYPTFAIGTEFDGSSNGTKNIYVQNKNVRIVYSGGDDKSYCVDIISKVVPNIRMFLNTTGGNQIPKTGTCDGGESSPIPTSTQTVFVFNTAAPGCAGAVQLPIAQPSSSSGTINWGDGASQTLSSSLQGHTYSTAGTYVVTYDGPITQVSYGGADSTKVKCLTKVNQWGSGAAPTVVNFQYATNFVYVAEPPTTVTNMMNMFLGATSFNQPIGNWNTANVTTMENMFNGATTFNQSLNGFNTANVTNMSGMFGGANAFNQSISSWNTGKVTNMNYMFHQAYAFNQPIGSWDVSKVTTMYGTFYHTYAFNQPIDTWNTANVVTMTNMFNDAQVFNQPLSSWNTAKVTDMGGMFSGAQAFNQTINAWNTANVTSMSGMFSNATSFNQPLGSWNTSKVQYFDWMFNNTPFNQNISGWNTTALINKTAFHASSPLTQPNCPAALW